MDARLKRILPRVQKPARYSGGEYNQIIKDKEHVALRMALCFPDVYEIGMSNLGMRILYDTINKQISINSLRSVCNSLCHFCLKSLCKGVIAFAGNNCQHVYVMDIVAQCIGIHTLAILVHAQAQATTDFLTLADIAAALFQCANLEYVRVIPAFTQGRMGEDESYWGPLRITIQQKLLVLHDQLISADIIRSRFFSTDLAVDHFALAVDGEVASMSL